MSSSDSNTSSILAILAIIGISCLILFGYIIPTAQKNSAQSQQTVSTNSNKKDTPSSKNNGNNGGNIDNPKPSTCSDPKIKGNINDKGEKIYHMPGQKYYNQTVITKSKGERMFCTEAEARDAGWRKSKV